MSVAAYVCGGSRDDDWVLSRGLGMFCHHSRMVMGLLAAILDWDLALQAGALKSKREPAKLVTNLELCMEAKVMPSKNKGH